MQTPNIRYVSRWVSILSLSLAAGCVATEEPGSESSTPNVLIVDTGGSLVILDKNSRNYPDPLNVVCDPFSQNPSYPGASARPGVVGTIHYQDRRIDATLFMDRVNLTSRPSDWSGFISTNGQALSSDGQSILQDFSLTLESDIKLEAGQAAGKYQFAMISDGGSYMEIDSGQGEGFKRVTDNTGTHTSRLACASEGVTLAAGQSLSMRIHHVQSTSNHSQVILLWRPWSGASFNPNDSACGDKGHGKWFNTAQYPATSKKAFNDLLGRGWKVLTAKNFQLPKRVSDNPCVEPTSTPTPSATPTATSTPSASPEPEPTVTPSETATPSPTPSETATPSPTPTETAEPSPTPTETATPSPTPTVTATATPTPTPTATLEPMITVITQYAPTASVSSITSASFSFNSNRMGATFECSLDGGVPTVCTSPTTYSGLADGNHTFTVWAIDLQGNKDPIGASYSWKVDTRAPLLSSITYVAGTDQILINWTTSEPSTSIVYWGMSSTNNSTAESWVYKTSHSVTLTGLEPDSLYVFSVGGRDPSGNAFTSTRYGIVTEP